MVDSLSSMKRFQAGACYWRF